MLPVEEWSSACLVISPTRESLCSLICNAGSCFGDSPEVVVPQDAWAPWDAWKLKLQHRWLLDVSAPNLGTNPSRDSTINRCVRTWLVLGMNPFAKWSTPKNAKIQMMREWLQFDFDFNFDFDFVSPNDDWRAEWMIPWSSSPSFIFMWFAERLGERIDDEPIECRTGSNRFFVSPFRDISRSTLTSRHPIWSQIVVVIRWLF